MAEKSLCNQKHAAIIVKGGRTLGLGVGRNRNNPDHVPDPKRQAAIHAEVAAIRSAGSTNLKGATIFVARVGPSGQMMSKPCANCQAELKRVGIRKVYFTINSEMEIR